MYNSRRLSAFTLVELLIVVIILAVIAAIAIPLMGNSSARSRLASQAQILQDLNNAVQRFNGDTGTYPLTLADLAATSPPPKGLKSDGTQTNISTTSWIGPYMPSIQLDPVSGSQFSYSVTSPTVGLVSAPSAGTTTTTTTTSTTSTTGTTANTTTTSSTTATTGVQLNTATGTTTSTSAGSNSTGSQGS